MLSESLGLFGIYGAALTLGAAHALEPGHGKTVVAAYLVGSRGRNLDAVLLGFVVTFTHSFGILLLGIAAKLSSRFFSEQQLHGYLGIVASLTILALGVILLKSRWKALLNPAGSHGHFHLFGGHHHHHHHDDDPSRREGPHAHVHEHVCDDGSVVRHSHSDKPGHVHEKECGRLGIPGLIMLGVSGGIVPCPAALALLLASVSVGNLGQGLVLVVVFSLGLALALVVLGLLVVNGVRVTSRFVDTERYAPKIAFTSALLVTMVGVYTFYTSCGHLMNL